MIDIIIKGKVVHGSGNGKKLLVPTFNLEYKNDIKIDYGVYASEVELNGEKYMGVTNVGKRPTLDNDDKITIETHILDFYVDIYDKPVTLILKEKIRETKKFESIELLKKQIENDIIEVRARSKKNV